MIPLKGVSHFGHVCTVVVLQAVDFSGHCTMTFIFSFGLEYQNAAYGGHVQRCIPGRVLEKRQGGRMLLSNDPTEEDNCKREREEPCSCRAVIIGSDIYQPQLHFRGIF